MFLCPLWVSKVGCVRSVNLLRSCVLPVRWTSSPALIRKHWKKSWKNIEHKSNDPPLPSAILRKARYPVRYRNSQVFCSRQTLFSLMYWWRAFVLSWSLDSLPDRNSNNNDDDDLFMLPVSCWSSVDVINVRRNLGAMVIYFGMFLADLRNDSKVHIYI